MPFEWIEDEPQKTLLFLAANPEEMTKLSLEAEAASIKSRLDQTRSCRISICSNRATQPKAIQQAILDVKPQIVHFSGHGAGLAGLAFEDEDGKAQLVSSAALANLFKVVASLVKCVVINACDSEAQALEIVQYIDFVIGMNNAITDRAALEFSAGFYLGLATGQTVEAAYQLGCNAIELAGLPERFTPVLHQRKPLPLQVLLVSNVHYYNQTPFRRSLNEILEQSVEVERYIGNCEKHLNDGKVNVILIDPEPPSANSFQQVRQLIEQVRSSYPQIHAVAICSKAEVIQKFFDANPDLQRFFRIDYEKAVSSASLELKQFIDQCETEHQLKHRKRFSAYL